jgi:hypothetical protein
LGEYLASLLGGVARFALAWMLPTAVAVGLFWAVAIPALAADGLVPFITGAPAVGSTAGRPALQATALAAFAIFAFAILLAYASQYIYRLLEGYHLPHGLAMALTRRQLRRRARLVATRDALALRPHGTHAKEYGLAVEQLEQYPVVSAVLPTRLGNALKAMESYGQDRFCLDSQQFWFELIATASDSMRREVEEMRAQVDLFIAAVAVFTLLAIASVGVAISTGAAGPVMLAGAAALFVPVAYRGALRNMKDWRNSVRAMVNLGRHPVAAGLGVHVPWTLEDERTMWRAVSGVLHYSDADQRPWLDVFRRGTPYADPNGVIGQLQPSDDATAPSS